MVGITQTGFSHATQNVSAIPADTSTWMLVREADMEPGAGLGISGNMVPLHDALDRSHAWVFAGTGAWRQQLKTFLFGESLLSV